MNGMDAFLAEVGRIIQPVAQAYIEAVAPVARQVIKTVDDAAMNMAMNLRAQRESADDYQIRRWLSQVPHGGIVGDKAVLIVYNEEHPSASYILVEDIKI